MFDTSILAAADAPSHVLHTIDFLIIITYFAGCLVIGSFYGKYVTDMGDLFLAGRTIPWWAIGMSVVSTDISATDFVAGAGATYRYGIAQANFDWLGSMPACIIAAFIFIPYYWRAGVFTIPEFLGRRYNLAVQIIEAIMWLLFLVCMLAVMLWMTAVMMETVVGWPPAVSIWVTVVVVGIYCISGGLTAVVITDVIQMIVMYIGGGALLVLGVWKAGGWSEMVNKVFALGDHYKNHFNLLLPHNDPTPYPWTGILFGLGIVLSTAYYVGNQAIVQRALGARSEWDAKGGMILAGFLKLFIPPLVMIPGLAALAIYPNLEKPDQAVPMLVREILPIGVKGLMFAAFFAALMSTVSSYLNSCCTMFMSDIYGKAYARLKGRPMSDRYGLSFGRILTGVTIIVGGLVAPYISGFETIYVGIQTLFSIFQGPTLALLLLGILWRRATQWGALAGLVLGVCLSTSLTAMGNSVFPSNNPFLFVSFWTFVFSLVVTVVVSLLTPPEPVEKLRGLVYGLVMQDTGVQQALNERVKA
jgi:solute:Na+ symporter, SSS family